MFQISECMYIYQVMELKLLFFEKFVKRYNSLPMWTLHQIPVAGPSGTW